MRFLNTLGLVTLVGACFGAANVLQGRNFETHDYFTLHLRDGESPHKIARSLGLLYDGPLGQLEGHYQFSAKRGEQEAETILEDVRQKIKKRDVLPEGLENILWSRKQRLKPKLHKRTPLTPAPVERAPPAVPEQKASSEDKESTAAIAQREQVVMELGINDPIFEDQWHLFNTQELGHDVNVTAVWLNGNTGKGAIVAVIDDGLDMYSDDLKDNYFAKGSYDFNDHNDEPKPKLVDDKHGTRCAGEVAAVKNNVCGVGVAYNSKVAGIRILGGIISDEDEALAINYGMQDNQIYSCSWGPPDNGEAMDAPDLLIKKAILTGIQKGRKGLGSVFVFAAGNGAASDDNCNFDGYTNSIYSITVGAIDRKGNHPYYSEKCSASLVVTYSSGAGDAIHTTDVGTDKCYSGHGGTSAAAPLGAGILALVLSERPDLSWRDLQYLVVESAVPINLDEEGADWQDTFIGKKYSHTYAYGKLDAYAIVEKAKDWANVKPQAWYRSPWQHVKHDIPQGDKGLTSTYEITEEMLKDANLERLEQVTVTMNAQHDRRGDMSVELISPHGVKSHLAATRKNDASREGYDDWTFMSVVHWGEPGVGKWTVVVKDTVVDDNSGNLTDWRISLWGESIDPKKAKPYPMFTDHDDDDHDKEPGDNDHTIPAIVGTTSVEVGETSELPAIPTDHPDRPVNNKPNPTAASPTAEQESSATESPSDSPSDAASTEAPNYHLPGIFPTFGVSPRTQIWIYGAASIILLFCIGLGCYFVIQRRRRKGPAYDSLEMDDSPDGGARQRRAGELYDAFAGESDEEETGLFSDSEVESMSEDAAYGEKGYRDDDSDGKRRSTRT